MWLDLKTTLASPLGCFRPGVREVPDEYAKSLLEGQKKAKGSNESFVETIKQTAAPRRAAKTASE